MTGTVLERCSAANLKIGGANTKSKGDLSINLKGALLDALTKVHK